MTGDFASAVRALGGSMRGPERASVPGPGHSRRDRSLSLLLKPDGRVIWYSFSGDDPAAVVAHLEASGLGVQMASTSLSRAQEREAAAARERAWAADAHERRRRRAIALKLWAAADDLSGTPAERYLRSRAIRADIAHADLRFHAHTPTKPYAPEPCDHCAALLAAVTSPSGAFVGLSLTYVREDGWGKAQGGGVPEGGRKFVGAIGGGAVRLGALAHEMVVGEGVESSLSAGDAVGVPAIAALSADGLRRFSPPVGVQRVVIAPDVDPSGVGAAAGDALARRLHGAGLTVSIARPPPPRPDAVSWDWNDAARAADAGRTDDR